MDVSYYMRSNIMDKENEVSKVNSANFNKRLAVSAKSIKNHLNETNEYKKYNNNNKSVNNSKNDSKSFIEENSCVDNISLETNQFDLKSSHKNFWSFKMTSFISLLLEKDFLESSINYESVLEIYQSIAFKDSFKNNLKKVK